MLALWGDVGSIAQTTWVAAVWMAVALCLAMWVDRRWGEPRAAFHPVVWMGKYLHICGRFSNTRTPAVAFVLGAVFWLLGAFVVGAIGWWVQGLAMRSALQWLTVSHPISGWHALQIAGSALLMLAVFVAFLKCLFAWQMLHDEAGAVEAALQRSLAEGRERLSWLVSRDTTALSAGEVRESAIESLAENVNDSVIAPIFWFVLFGLPGAAVYRFANTADAMWGYRGTYRGQHWEWAGKWAARADDVLSWLPARITALLIAQRRIAWTTLATEARKTPSPNSGWPMAAMALALGITLRKPGVYQLNASGAEPGAAHVGAAQGLAGRVVRMFVRWSCGMLLLIALIGLMGVVGSMSARVGS